MNGTPAAESPLFQITMDDRTVSVYQFMPCNARYERRLRLDLNAYEKKLLVARLTLASIGIVLFAGWILYWTVWPKPLPSELILAGFLGYMLVVCAAVFVYVHFAERGSRARREQERLLGMPHKKRRRAFVTEDDFSFHVIVSEEGRVRGYPPENALFLALEPVMKADLFLYESAEPLESQTPEIVRKRYLAKVAILDRVATSFSSEDFANELKAEALEQYRSELRILCRQAEEAALQATVYLHRASTT